MVEIPSTVKLYDTGMHFANVNISYSLIQDFSLLEKKAWGDMYLKRNTVNESFK